MGKGDKRRPTRTSQEEWDKRCKNAGIPEARLNNMEEDEDKPVRGKQKLEVVIDDDSFNACEDMPRY